MEGTDGGDGNRKQVIGSLDGRSLYKDILCRTRVGKVSHCETSPGAENLCQVKHLKDRLAVLKE